MSIFHKLPPMQNVGANQTAIMPNPPLGMTYKALHFQLGGTAFTKAQMTNIRVRLQGKQIVDVTGANLDTMNQHMKRVANVAYQSLYFGDPNGKTFLGQMLGAIDTSRGVSTMEIEVDIGAATAPTLQVWAEFMPPKSIDDPNRDVIRALLKATHAISAAGEFSQPIPLGSVGGASIKRILAFHTNVTRLQVTKDGLWLLQEGEEALLDYLGDVLTRGNQAGLIVFDPTQNDYASDRVPVLRPNGQPATFEFKYTTSAADTIVTYSDLLTTIDRV